MISVASKLKSEREKRGVALAQIASDTHISLRHLESLEEGRYGDLPGGIYNRAFLRAYCESIQLDPSEFIERYEQETSPHGGRHSRAGAKTRSGSISLGINPTIIWSLMLLVSASGIYAGRKWIAEIFSPYFSHSSAPVDHYETLTNPIQDPREPVSLSIEETAASHQSFIAALETPDQMRVPGDEGDINSPGSHIPLIRLELAATEQCWIVIERDGTPVVRKLMNPGEVESLGAAEKLFIILGNAGGVHLKINGMPAKPLGQSGEVLRLLITEKSIPNLLEQTAG